MQIFYAVVPRGVVELYIENAGARQRNLRALRMDWNATHLLMMIAERVFSSENLREGKKETFLLGAIGVPLGPFVTLSQGSHLLPKKVDPQRSPGVQYFFVFVGCVQMFPLRGWGLVRLHNNSKNGAYWIEIDANHKNGIDALLSSMPICHTILFRFLLLPSASNSDDGSNIC